MEISWEQMISAAGDCDSDSCTSWESVAASEDGQSDEWDVLSAVGSVQSIDSSNRDDGLDAPTSYKDVLLRSKAWAINKVVTPVIKPWSPAPWKITALHVLPATPQARNIEPSNGKDGSALNAESIRDGVKQCRGGRQERMFKGNEKHGHKYVPSWYSDAGISMYLKPALEKKKHRHRQRKGKRSLKSLCGIDAA